MQKHKIQKVAKRRRTTNGRTKIQKTPTSSKVRLFPLVHIAKGQTIPRENVGGGRISSAENVAIWDI